MATPFSSLNVALQDLFRRRPVPKDARGRPLTIEEATSFGQGAFGAEEGPTAQHFTDPVAVENLVSAGGGLVETPANLLRTLWQARVNKWNAVLPGAVSPNRILPEALAGTDKPIEGLSLPERVGRFVNAKTLGMVDDFSALEREQELRSGKPSTTFGESANNKVAAAQNLAIQELTPIPEATTILTGKVKEGVDETGQTITREATAGDITQAMMTGLMKTVPAAALFSRFFSGRFVAGLGKNPVAKLSKTMTVREAANPDTPLAIAAEQRGIGTSELSQTASALEPSRIAFNDAVRVIGQTVQHQLFKDIFSETRATDPPGVKTQVTDILRSVAEKPDVLSPDLLGELAIKYDMPMAEVSKEIGKRLRDEATMTGLFQSTLSAAEAVGQTSLWKRAMEGDIVARDALRAQSELTHLGRRIDAAKGGQEGNVLAKVAGGLTKVENARRIALAGVQLATTMRNMKSFTLNATSRWLADRIVAKSYGLDPDDAEVSPSGFHLDYIRKHAEALEAAEDMSWHERILGPAKDPRRAQRALKARQATQLGILGELPQTTGRLFDNMSFDVAAGSLKGFMEDFKPSNYSDRVDWIRGMLTAGSRTAEITSRKIRFFSKLESHAERLGYGDLDGVLLALRNEDKLAPDIRHAIADAEVDALKTTFGYRYPNTGPFSAGAVLDAYRDFYPLSTILTTPFPRFVVNSWKMLEETSPHHWMYLFNPEFRKKLQSHARNDFASYEGREVLARGLTSGLKMMGALAIRSGAMSNVVEPGPEYYKVKWNTGPYQGKYESFEQYAPFDRYLAVADAAVKLSKGHKFQDIFTPNELFNFATYARRFDEIAIFDFPNLVRAFGNSEGPTAGDIFKDTAAKTTGRYISGFTVPLGAVRDTESAVRQMLGSEVNVSNTAKDTTESPLFGPTLANLPKLGGLTDQALLNAFDLDTSGDEIARSNRVIPTRISMWTGTPEYTENPALRTFFGASISRMTPLQAWVQSQPGLDATQLHTTFKSPRGTNLVDYNQGQMIKSMEPALMQEIEKGSLAQMEPEVRNWLVMGLLKEVRRAATDVSKAERPDWFVDEDTDSQDLPKPLKQLMKRVLRGELSKQFEGRTKE